MRASRSMSTVTAEATKACAYLPQAPHAPSAAQTGGAAMANSAPRTASGERSRRRTCRRRPPMRPPRKTTSRMARPGPGRGAPARRHRGQHCAGGPHSRRVDRRGRGGRRPRRAAPPDSGQRLRQSPTARARGRGAGGRPARGVLLAPQCPPAPCAWWHTPSSSAGRATRRRRKRHVRELGRHRSGVASGPLAKRPPGRMSGFETIF